MPTQHKKDFTSPNTKNYCYTVKKQLQENTMLCYFDDNSEPRNHQAEFNTDAPSTQLVHLTFRGPRIVIYSKNESQWDALFLKFIS